MGAGGTGTTNPAQPALDGINPIPARTFTPDTTPPIFTEFSIFVLNSGVMVVTFDEPVDIGTIVFENITLLESDSDSSGITLSTGSVEYVNVDRTTIQIMVSLSDLDSIKRTTTLATLPTNTYLEVARGAVEGTSNNVFNNTLALQVTTLLPDRTSPNLISFNFDLDAGLLTLSFDDIVDASRHLSILHLYTALPISEVSWT